ncbi:1393_t:CDS:2 [Ambispora gerdemannii]|uniref:1393_t:CDS:1 n=1 Tax=Ambispora gerdemannii TaxID=144530 RepID=A0A9N9A163_9GLOM|nr:1393_t:CDS:2 [Ambispora gerdemannii]
MSDTPPEILQEIFQKLVGRTDDLYSLLFVNRHWCANVIVTLWRNPFYQAKYQRKVIDTYLLCLPKKSLRRLGLEHIIRDQNPLFNYPAYLKSFSIKDIFFAVEDWHVSAYSRIWQKSDNVQSTLDLWVHEYQIVTEICNLISNGSTALESFSIDTLDLEIAEIISGYDLELWKGIEKRHHITFESISFNKIIYPRESDTENLTIIQDIIMSLLNNSKNLLKKIRKFECGGSLLLEAPNLLEIISNVATNIETFIVSAPNEDEHLEPVEEDIIQFIQVQNRLRKLEFREWCFETCDVAESLSMRHATLRELEFHECTFFRNDTLKGLQLCTGLESLKFIDVAGVTSNVLDTISNTIFPNLKHLTFSQHYTCIDEDEEYPSVQLADIIENNSKSLQSLCLAQIQFKWYTEVLPMLARCKNLRKLQLQIEEYEEFLVFYDVLKACQNLRSLELLGECLPREQQWPLRDGNNKVFVEMARYVPSNLEYLLISLSFVYSPTELATFLEYLKHIPRRIILEVEEKFAPWYLQTMIKCADNVGRKVVDSRIEESPRSAKLERVSVKLDNRN